MLKKQKSVYDIIYLVGHVVYTGGWYKIPQQRLSGKATVGHCPFYVVLHFLAKVTHGYPHSFNEIF